MLADRFRDKKSILAYNILKEIVAIRIQFFRKKRIPTTCLPLICTKSCQKTLEAAKSKIVKYREIQPFSQFSKNH